jgi:hypothetical protein
MLAAMVAASGALTRVLRIPTGERGEAAVPPTSNQRVTHDNDAGSYLQYDNSLDRTTSECAKGRREQNEPTIAVDPHDRDVVVAGANDACAAIVGDVWVGYYRSTDGGVTWGDSLVPGYFDDTSEGGTASPARRLCAAASDPSMAFDRAGRLFYAFLCINRPERADVRPDDVAGSIVVATYDSDGERYARTALVFKGSKEASEDKVNLTVDQGTGPGSGNVYVVWTEITPNGEVELFSRSTDQGQTFSNPMDVTAEFGAFISPDATVGPDGSVYVTYRNITNIDAIWIIKSTDQGQSFGGPSFVSMIEPFDSDQFAPGRRRDCGDGPFQCEFTFPRFSSKAAVAADESGVHVVWDARLTRNGQAKIFVRNSRDGVQWSTPAAPIDPVAAGHQWFPDVASGAGVITVVFYDSRVDRAYAPDRPPGNTARGSSSGAAVDVFVARSRDGGRTWSERRVTTESSNPNFEAGGRVPFFGDYIYVSAAGIAVYMAWTDSRDVVTGKDPRERGEDDDNDGFDVFAPCRYEPKDIGAKRIRRPLIDDPCLSQGGSDENIYAARIG